MSNKPSPGAPTVDTREIRAHIEAMRGCGCRGCEMEHQVPLLDGAAALCDEVDRLESSVERLTRERDEWVEREAKACPEDFSFEEVIASLRKQLQEVTDAWAQQTAALVDAKKDSDRLNAWEALRLEAQMCPAMSAEGWRFHVPLKSRPLYTGRFHKTFREAIDGMLQHFREAHTRV